MKTQQILKAFDCSPELYKKVCDTLGGIDGDAVPASKIGDFDLVLSWFNENKSLSVKSAIARYQELSKEEVSPVIEEIAPLIDEAAHTIMRKLTTVAKEEEANLSGELRTALRARIYQLSKEPEYRQSFQKMLDGETAEEVGKPYPALLTQELETSTALPPGLD